MPCLWPQVRATAHDTYLIFHNSHQRSDSKDYRCPFDRQHQAEHCRQARVAQALAEAGQQISNNIPHRNDAKHDPKLLWLHGRITKALDGFRCSV